MINTGESFTLNKKRTDAKHYRIQSDIAQKLLSKAKTEITAQAHLIFDMASSPIRYQELDKIRGQKGCLKISNLSVLSEIEQHDTMIFTGYTTDHTMSEQTIRDLLNLKASVDQRPSIDTAKLDALHQLNKKNKLDHLEKTDTAYMQREFTKFEHWADDKIRELEYELRDDRQKIKELERDQHRENILAEELLTLQEAISKIKRKYNRLRQEIYDREDEINEQRDAMIAEAKSKLTRSIREEELFTISFEII